MKLLISVLLALFWLIAVADKYVRGYTKRDGSYVDPHRLTIPNSR